MSFLIYGANGYTGSLTAKLARERGLKPILAGRSREKVEPLANSLQLPWRAFSLGNVKEADNALADVDVVLHCAGPFSRTYREMADACLRTSTHYLDITGEVEVFEGLAARSKEAELANVMLMPGVGFDVVPSDCLAAHLHHRLPSAHRLTLGFQGLGRLSQGTMNTMVENLGRGGLVRENGALKEIPAGSRTRKIDFGRGEVLATAIPWGDVSTAYHSTGIPNIEVYSVFPSGMRGIMGMSRWIGGLLQTKLAQSFFRSQVRKQPAGPSDAERERGLSLLWGEASDPNGRRAVSRIKGPEGYTLTALTSLLVVGKVLEGQHPAGFQTPSKAFGKDLIMEIPGVSREDLA